MLITFTWCLLIDIKVIHACVCDIWWKGLRCCVQVSVHYISLLFSLIIHSSVPRWHIVIFTHIWLFDEQNNDLQLSSVERFLANGRSARKQISNAIFISIWSERLIYCVLLFYYSCFLIDQIFFLCKCKHSRVCAAGHIKPFQTYCLNCAVICFSYMHINTALCRILTLVNIRNGVQFTTTHQSGNQDRAVSWYSH